MQECQPWTEHTELEGPNLAELNLGTYQGAGDEGHIKNTFKCP